MIMNLFRFHDWRSQELLVPGISKTLFFGNSKFLSSLPSFLSNTCSSVLYFFSNSVPWGFNYSCFFILFFISFIFSCASISSCWSLLTFDRTVPVILEDSFFRLYRYFLLDSLYYFILYESSPFHRPCNFVSLAFFIVYTIQIIQLTI